MPEQGLISISRRCGLPVLLARKSNPRESMRPGDIPLRTAALDQDFFQPRLLGRGQF